MDNRKQLEAQAKEMMSLAEGMIGNVLGQLKNIKPTNREDAEASAKFYKENNLSEKLRGFTKDLNSLKKAFNK